MYCVNFKKELEESSFIVDVIPKNVLLYFLFPRKIPEPFASTWLQMVSDDKEEKNAASTQIGRGKKSANGPVTSTSSLCVVMKEEKEEIVTISSSISGSNSAATNSVKSVVEKLTDSELSENTDLSSDPKIIELDFIAKNKEKFQKKKNDEVEKTLDRDSADWLCDECNAQNFAKLLSGVKRLKCFKCQAVRGSSNSLVKSVAEVRVVLHCIVWCVVLCFVVGCIVWYYVVLCCIVLYCVVLYCMALYCIA